MNPALDGLGVLGGVWIPEGESTSEERMRREMHSFDSVRGPLRYVSMRTSLGELLRRRVDCASTRAAAVDVGGMYLEKR